MGHVSEALKKSQGEWSKEFAGTESKAKDKVEVAVAPALPRQRKGLPTVGADAVSYSATLAVWHDRSGRICEQYRGLRTHLLAHYKDKPFSLIITSAQAGEGKTVTCANLGFILAAQQECRTVIVDCDFRKGGISSILRDRYEHGVADVLRGHATPQDVVRATPLANLSVILAGKARSEEVGELVSRPELDDLARYLRRNYDYVLFDTPPVNNLSDAGVVGRVAGDALLVVRMSRTRRESVKEAIRHLEAVDVKVAGLVLAGQKYFIPNYLYRYS